MYGSEGIAPRMKHSGVIHYRAMVGRKSCIVKVIKYNIYQ